MVSRTLSYIVEVQEVRPLRILLISVAQRLVVTHGLYGPQYCTNWYIETPSKRAGWLKLLTFNKYL